MGYERELGERCVAVCVGDFFVFVFMKIDGEMMKHDNPPFACGQRAGVEMGRFLCQHARARVSRQGLFR